MNKEKAPCTILFIAINVIVFLVLSFVGTTEDAEFMLDHGAMYVPNLMENQEYYRFFTSLFLHFGIEHLANNMLVLGVTGWQLESKVGSVKFFIIYFLSGLGGNALSVWANLQKEEFPVSAGASGAVLGIIGALLYVALRNVGQKGSLSPKGFLFMALFSLYLGFANQGVNNMAHLGGLVAGFLSAFLLYRKPNSKSSSRRRG